MLAISRISMRMSFVASLVPSWTAQTWDQDFGVLPLLPATRVHDCYATQVGHSTAYAADRAMQNLMNNAYNDATGLLSRNRAAMDELVTRLHTPTADHDPS